jgi:hypothetical protein
MVAVPDLARPADLAQYRNGDEGSIVRQVQAAVRSYCGWHIAPAMNETVTLDGTGTGFVRLPTLQLNSVDAVTNAGTAITVSDGVDWSDAGFIQLRNGARFTDRPGQVTVTMNHGFTDPPPDVVEVVVSVAARAASSPVGAVSESAGGVSLSFGTFNGVAGGIALLAHERAVLDLYRLAPRT